MISLKLGAIIIGAFAAGAFVMSPVPQAIAAVIATDVQCTGCLGTADLAGNAITATKIKDNEVKAAEIAANAVGASELQGVTKLEFRECSISFATPISSGFTSSGLCPMPGLTTSDKVIVTKEHGNPCFLAANAVPENGNIRIYLVNACNNTGVPGVMTYAVMVYRGG